MGPTLFVCTNRRHGTAGSCAGGGSLALMMALRTEIEARGLAWQVSPSLCLGHCAEGPNVKAAPRGPLLHQCRADRAERVVDDLLASGWPLDPV